MQVLIEDPHFEEIGEKLLETYDGLVSKDAKDSDIKRENANIDGDTSMGTMLKIGSESSKVYYESCIIDPKFVELHKKGYIHIHDEDFYALTLNCCQIDCAKLFKNGFSTGHGFIREPKDIRTYGSLACIAIQANQNDQHGGQSIPTFDFDMAPGVAKTFIKEVAKTMDILGNTSIEIGLLKDTLKEIYETKGTLLSADVKEIVLDKIDVIVENKEKANHIFKKALEATANATFQSMEAVIHNLNTMHSRAGAQVPFSSLNYGTDTSEEGRLVMKCLLRATQSGLGNGETPIFPIQIFKVKDGVSANPGDPNYDLFELACEVSAKRLFPNFSFLDAPFNAQYYDPKNPKSEVAYMGCRTRVIGNFHDKEQEVTHGRGNLSFTSINLPRLAIEAKGDLEVFYSSLDDILEATSEQLLERYEIQAKRKVRNFPFLMGQSLWLDSDNLKSDDEVREAIKHGSLSFGFIGIAETVLSLTGSHHGESMDSWRLGYEIVKYIRDFADAKAKETKLNFSVIASPAEGLCQRFLRIDRKEFGEISGITDKEFYTNSFHIPVYYPIDAINKIKLEAPFHDLTNAGHISYVEMDGDPTKNLEAFKEIIHVMKKEGIGYGAINHPVDRCPVCGFVGIIEETCPCCHRRDGEAVLLTDLPLEKQKEILGD